MISGFNGVASPMSVATPPPIRERLRLIVALCLTFSVALSAFDLIGWQLGIDSFLRALQRPGAAPMAPKTATALLGTTLALWLAYGASPGSLRQRFGQFLAVGAVLFGLVSVIEFMIGAGLELDLFLVGQSPHRVMHFLPGRPAPMTAVCFVACGLATLLLPIRSRPLSTVGQVLAVLLGLVGLQAMVAYIFGEGATWDPAISSGLRGVLMPMCLHAAAAFAALALGLMSILRDGELIAFLMRNDSAGLMARRLIPAAILVPILVSWLRLAGEQAGLYSMTFGVSLMAVIMIALLVGLIGWSGYSLRQLDRVRTQTERALRRSEESLASAQQVAHMGSVDWDLQHDRRYWSDETYRLLGYTPGEVEPSLAAFLARVHPDDRERIAGVLWHGYRTGKLEGGEYRVVRPDGAIRYVSSEVQNYSDESGTPIRWLATLLDITERKEMETALNEARVRLELALQAGRIGTCIIDMEHQLVLADERLAELFGVPYDSAGIPIASYVARLHPDDQPRAMHDMAAVVERGAPLSGEYRVLEDDGSVTWLASRGAVEKNKQGVTVRIPAALIDVTELKKAEEALRESEARFRTAFSHAPIGIALVTPDGRWLNVNRCLKSMLGYEEEELLAGRWQDITHPDDLEPDLANLRRLLAGEIPSYQMDKRYFRKDGRIIWVQLTASLIRNRLGEPLYALSQLQDITEARRHAFVQELQAAAGTLLASALDPAATLRAISRWVVPALADWCEIQLRDAEGRVVQLELAAATPDQDLRLHQRVSGFPSELDRFGPQIGAALRHGATLLLTDLEKDGPSAWAAELPGAVPGVLAPGSMMVVPLRARGRTLGSIVLAATEPSRRYDTHDLALAEQLAGRAALAIDNALLYQASEQATRTRDEVLRIVAHDLRSPLTGISVTTQVLMRRLSPADLGKGELIMKEIDRASRLIEDLLDVARMEAGRLTVERRPEAVTPLVRYCIDAHRPQAEAASLELSAQVAEGIPLIYADRERVAQILANLLGNAIKFTPAGGRVVLRVDPSGEMVRFSVEDTGPGIPREQTPHLFEPFWQGGGRSRLGAGLGLAIVKGLVEAHGGRIWVERGREGGSVFHFTLPALQAVSATA